MYFSIMAVSLLLLCVPVEIVVSPLLNRVKRTSVALVDSVLQQSNNGLRGDRFANYLSCPSSIRFTTTWRRFLE